MLRRPITLLLCLAGAACEQDAPSTPEPRLERIEVAGCREVRRGRRCEIRDRADLTVWVKAKPGTRWRLEGVEPRWVDIDGGRRGSVEVTTASTALVFLVDGGPGARVELVRWTPPPALADLADAARRTATVALSGLDALVPGDDLRLHSEIETTRARLALARGAYDDAIAHRRASAALSDAAGLVSKTAMDHATIAYIALTAKRDIATARAALEQVRRRLPETIGPEAAVLAYYEGVLARATGDTRAALRHLRRAERRARRLSHPVAASAAQLRADLYGLLGYHRRALRLYEALAADWAEAPLKAQAILRGNRAWATVMAREAGIAVERNPRADARAALEVFTSSVSWPQQVPNLSTTIALAAVQEGDVEGALGALARARAHARDAGPEVRLWAWDVEARAAQRAGRDEDARAAYDELEALAQRLGSSVGVWRAHAGRAGLHRARGELEAARVAYAAAEARLDGRDALRLEDAAMRVDARDRVARAHADVMIRLDEPEAAVEVLSRHAARAWRGLERSPRLARLEPAARARWDRAVLEYGAHREALDRLERSAWGRAGARASQTAAERRRLRDALDAALGRALDALGQADAPLPAPRPPRPKELILTLDRLPKGWWATAHTQDGLRTVEFGTVPAPSALLRTFDELLATHPHVTLALRGEAGRLDVHAASWRGRPLVASHRVAFRVDAPAVAPAADGDTLLIVADPKGDLPSARDEAREVRRRWPRARLLVGPDASRARFVEALRGAHALHWAGHAQQDPRLGFSAALPLADGAALEVGDILALRHVPSRVVLSGCATAPVTPRDLGPARAFLLAGAAEVLATTRRVTDADAAAVTSALYAGREGSLEAALSKVQRSLAADGSRVDWAAFRVLVP